MTETPQYFLASPCPVWSRERNNRFKFYRVGELDSNRAAKSGAVFDGEKMEWVKTDLVSFSMKKRDMTEDEINYCNNGVLK